MRKQFDGLAAVVTHAFGMDVLSGDYFVFLNRQRNRCKILCWDRDGFAIWAKRLERGRFQMPLGQQQQPATEIDPTTLAMILGGVDLASAKRRKRYQLPPSTSPALTTAPRSAPGLQSASPIIHGLAALAANL